MARATIKKSDAGKNKKKDRPAELGHIRSPLAAQAFLDSADVSRKIVQYGRLATIFAQGDPCDSVMYIQAGAVRLSVLSKSGKEAIVATLGPGDFLGEGALAAQRVRIGTATAVVPSRILVVPKDEMVRSASSSTTAASKSTGLSSASSCTNGVASSRFRGFDDTVWCDVTRRSELLSLAARSDGRHCQLTGFSLPGTSDAA